MNARFWNIIHDGAIEAIDGQVPGDVVLTIGIAYLCEHLPTAGDVLEATLRDCQLLTYTPFGEPTVTDFLRIGEDEAEVLSAVAKPDRILVCCTNGSLDVAYRAVEVRTVEGRLISQEEMETAADRSVMEWLKRKGGGQAAG